MRLSLIAALVAAACGSDTRPERSPPDGPVDGPPASTALTPSDLTCVTHTRTAIAANGTRTDSHQHFALVDMTRDDDFAVEACDQAVFVDGVEITDSCPAGSTCSESGAANPPGPICNWQRRSGTFTGDGRLFVFCGSGSTTTPAGGSPSSLETRFKTVRIWR